MINRTVLVGRLTKDPELKYTQSGLAVVRFTLAVNRAFKNGQGEQEADFIQCTAWRKTAENVANYLKKGSLCGVDGRIQTGSFDGQDGKKVYTTDVVADSVQFLESKKESPAGHLPPDLNNANGGNYNSPNNAQNNAQGYQAPQQTNIPNGQYNANDGGSGQPQQYGQPQAQQNQYSQPTNDPFTPGNGPIEVTDDDLPF